MEVGAVKQAFNNEVILLKKKLNQARTQIIHKLTRKAKTLTEKKAPEHLKEKLKKKAESAVNEVLIMKKIKARDIAQFAITHKDKLQVYLNKPTVDKDKVCARLLLHKALQDKYNFMRDRFGDVPIKDLFMSRQERKKLKQEQKDMQKNKKKGKGKDKTIVNLEGDWDVEDIKNINTVESKNEIEEQESDSAHSGDESAHSDFEMDVDNDQEPNEKHHYVESGDEKQTDDQNGDEAESNAEQNDDQSESDEQNEDQSESEEQNDVQSETDNENDSSDVEPTVGKFVRLNSNSETDEKPKETKPTKFNKPELTKRVNIKPKAIEKSVPQKKPFDKKVKENKNKNLNEKLQSRKFKKDESLKTTETKTVDPFFITATGENYLSLAEPRQPDEVKEIHKQGNRQERRAAMFGHVPKIKPRNDHRQNFNNNFDKQNRNPERRNFNQNSDDSGFKPRFNKFNDNQHPKFNDDNKFNNNRNTKFKNDNRFDSSKFDKPNDRKFNNFNNKSEEKVEKLHPSWEAKKKQSSIVPFQGKKIVFDG